MILTRTRPEIEQERRRKFLLPSDVEPSPLARMNRTMREVPIVTQPMEIATSIDPRPVEELNYIPPPARAVFNNKGRPTGAEGGFSQLSRDEALLEAQRAYKPKGSTKNLLIGLGLGFLRGGLPGLAAGGLQYALDPAAMDRAQNERAMGQTSANIDEQFGKQRADQQWRLNEAQLGKLEREPDNLQAQAKEKDYQSTVENLRQLRATTDPQEFEQLKRQEEIRLGRVIQLPKYSKQDQPEESAGFTLPPGGARYKVKPDGTVSTVVERPGLPVPSNADVVGTAQAKAEALKTRVMQAQSAAEAYRQQLADLDKSAGSIPTYAPGTVKDETGIERVATNPDGTIVYDTQKKSLERLAYERNREDLQRKLDQATLEWNTANSELNSIYVPPLRGGNQSQPLTRQSKTLDPALEARIRAAAKQKGLDPDVAVERARARQ